MPVLFGTPVPAEKQAWLADIDRIAAPDVDVIASARGFRYLGMTNRYLVFERLDRSAIRRDEARRYAGELYHDLMNVAVQSPAVDRLVKESEGLRIA